MILLGRQNLKSAPASKWPKINEINLSFFIINKQNQFQHVDEENSYLCGYLQINGLTDEYPTLTTFFDGEIISQKYPFLTRKWDADEDVDKKHWVCNLDECCDIFMHFTVALLDSSIFFAILK